MTIPEAYIIDQERGITPPDNRPYIPMPNVEDWRNYLETQFPAAVEPPRVIVIQICG